MSTSTTEYPMFEYAPSRPSLMIMDRTIKWKPNNFELAPNCPRCASSNTKFCYYNNYSFSQPRYFCKACRRYWTKGGSLRNVPVGGGCRKTRRTRSTRHEDGADYPIHTVGSGCVETINQSESGGEIDLGAVFANENVENDAASDEVPVSSSDIDPQIGDSNPVFACAEPVDMINGSDQNTDDQDFVYRNYSGFEMEGVFGEVEADMLWSEGIEFPSFGSELQDFEMFSAYDDDDQMRISANLVNDNWDYEIFTGP